MKTLSSERLNNLPPVAQLAMLEFNLNMSVWKVHVLHYSVNFLNKKIYMILQSICNDTKMLVEEEKALGLHYSCWTELHPEESLAKGTELIRQKFELAWDPSRPQPQS